MGWLRSVGFLKLQVSFAEYHLFYRALLQKRPTILKSLLIVATPYYDSYVHYIIARNEQRINFRLSPTTPIYTVQRVSLAMQIQKFRFQNGILFLVKSHSHFEFVLRDTEESEFHDSMDFENVVFSRGTVLQKTHLPTNARIYTKTPYSDELC